MTPAGRGRSTGPVIQLPGHRAAARRGGQYIPGPAADPDLQGVLLQQVEVGVAAEPAALPPAKPHPAQPEGGAGLFRPNVAPRPGLL